MHRSAKIGCAALLVLASLATSADAAEGRKRSMMTGALLGAAGVAGAALLLGGSAPAQAAPPPRYVEEEVVVQRPRPQYVPTCQMVRKRIWIDGETYTYKRVEVCE